MSLLNARAIYKPFKYPWAYDAWLQQQRIHWIPEEVPKTKLVVPAGFTVEVLAA
mgnify:CR=1 FL=1